MKSFLVILIFIVQTAFSAELAEIGNSREKLNQIAGVDESAAKELLVAIKTKSPSELQRSMEIIIEEDRSHIVSIALYDESDDVMQAAAKALAKSKKSSTVMSLLDAAKNLELSFRGGTEAYIRRDKTKLIFEQTLVQVTGVEVQKDWTPEVKSLAFKRAAEMMSNQENLKSVRPRKRTSAGSFDASPSADEDSESEASNGSKDMFIHGSFWNRILGGGGIFAVISFILWMLVKSRRI